jgi:hypothetical protein
MTAVKSFKNKSLKTVMKDLRSRLFLRSTDTVLEILVRGRRNSARSIEADPPDGSDLSIGTEDQGRAANDQAANDQAGNENGKAWPLVPFPDGWWYGG